ncbi:hypothetical protein ACQ4M3_09350 [Leptolyngbya sp. AN03gr2]|uniref:hypothetical protein n=1 Tax=Leptolyngbya sp. AN03gr2 TaxID=3423364 RepID=UPI003D322372
MSEFDKLPEEVEVSIEITRQGILRAKVQDESLAEIIGLTNTENRADIFLQTDTARKEFIEEFVPLSDREDLDNGWEVEIKMSMMDYIDWVFVQFGSIADQQRYLTREYLECTHANRRFE